MKRKYHYRYWEDDNKWHEGATEQHTDLEAYTHIKAAVSDRGIVPGRVIFIVKTPSIMDGVLLFACVVSVIFTALTWAIFS